MNDDEIKKQLREVTDIIGPHGSVSRLQAGGVRIDKGVGIGVFENGVLKTTILPDGNFRVGTDIGDPALTTMCLFVNEQVYNGELMGAGDMLIGDNSAANMFYDASAGQLQFRDGTTVKAYADTDGSIKAGGGDVTIDEQGIWITNQQAAFGFEDTNGDRFKLYLYSDGSDLLGLINEVPSAGIVQKITTTNSATVSLVWGEDTVTNGTILSIFAGAAGARLVMGGGVNIVSGRDGVTTVFNEDSYDIDFRIESATNIDAFKLDAGAETISMLGDVIVDGGTDHRLEIGADHYFPTRNASNPNGFWNEANQDMNFTFEGTTDANLLMLDAGLDAIGIGTTASSEFKVRISGTVKVQNIRSRATTLTDDTAVAITPSETDGIMNIYTQGANDWAVVRYNTVTPSNVTIEVGSNTNVTTGILSGTTGTDTKFTVSCHTDGNIYVENRTGSSRSVYVLLI